MFIIMHVFPVSQLQSKDMQYGWLVSSQYKCVFVSFSQPCDELDIKLNN